MRNNQILRFIFFFFFFFFFSFFQEEEKFVGTLNVGSVKWVGPNGPEKVGFLEYFYQKIVFLLFILFVYLFLLLLLLLFFF